MTIIGESQDVDTKKIKEFVGLLQTDELTLPSPKKSMSTALKVIEEVENDSSDEDDIEQDVVFLVKNFMKLLKLKNNGNKGANKSFQKGE